VLAAVLRPESKENGSVAAYGGLELALGGAIGGGVLGETVGMFGWLGQGGKNANLMGAVSSSALECRGKRNFPRRLEALSLQRWTGNG